MADILDMQFDSVDAPAEEKASKVSLRWCRNSFVSVVLCFVK